MLNNLRLRLRALIFKSKMEEELDEEVRFHLEREIEENIVRRMTPEEARYAALRSFGGVERVKEESRDVRGVRLLEELWQDLRYGVRMLLKQSGFTLIAVLTLALGIGANTAIFSVVNSTLLKPLLYSEPERLVWVAEVLKNGQEVYGAADYLHWREQSQSFVHLAAYLPETAYLTGRGEPEQLESVAATANLFPALGVAPLLGRTFTPEEDHPGAAPVVILSHAFWQRRFGGDPALIGQSLTLDGRSRRVIGVMPPEFRFLRKADVLLPRALDVQRIFTIEGMTHLGNMIGRLRPSVTPESARMDLETILQRLREANPRRNYGSRVSVTPLGEKLVGDVRLGLLGLFGAVALILLIACANIANLLLARTSTRRKELAIRAALGAGRWRLVRQMLMESLLLSLCGGVVGVWLALLGVKALVPLIPDELAHLKVSSVDGTALGFTFFASLLTGVVAGLLPALQISQVDLNGSLKEGARGAVAATGNGAHSVSPVLVVGELALTMSLLVAAGLLIRSYLQLRAVEPGYNAQNLLTMKIPIYTARYSRPQRMLFYRELLARLNTLPGVEVAALGPLPLKDMRLDSGEAKTVGDSTCCLEVSADYFRALGMPLLAGRSFTEQDHEIAAPVAIINESAARRDYPGESPIGRPAAFGRRGRPIGTIVGVVADVKRYGLASGVQDAEQYSSVLQNAEDEAPYLMVRTVNDPLKLAPSVRQQVWALNPNLPVVDVMPMEQRLAESVAPRRFQMMLFAIFATLALVLAAVGVYGVISYAVSRRTHEIGIRMALGAQRRDVLLLVVRQGMALAMLGVTLGAVATLALTRVMKSLLFNVSVDDPVTFELIALLLASVAFLACYLPARRATKVDPLIALRSE